MNNRIAALLVLGGALTLQNSARADTPPPGGYIEHCTVAEQGGSTSSCVLCGGAYYGDRDKCKRDHASDGYVYRCKTWGASAWQEVWCTTIDGGIEADAAADNEAAKSDGCSIGFGSPRGAAFFAAGLGLALALLNRSRKRRS
jgi:hypothetical protein